MLWLRPGGQLARLPECAVDVLQLSRHRDPVVFPLKSQVPRYGRTTVRAGEGTSGTLSAGSTTTSSCKPTAGRASLCSMAMPCTPAETCISACRVNKPLSENISRRRLISSSILASPALWQIGGNPSTFGSPQAAPPSTSVCQPQTTGPIHSARKMLVSLILEHYPSACLRLRSGHRVTNSFLSVHHFHQQTVPSDKLMNSFPSAAIRPSKTGDTCIT